MDKKHLRMLLREQNKEKITEKYVPREVMSRIKEHIETPFVIIISGIRRSGKSTLLKLLWKKLDGYYVNFDDERFINFTVHDFQAMYEVLIEIFGEKDNFFFDEIQNIEAWERFVRRLNENNKKIYITGSNASMLSRKFGTHLTGRNIVIPLYPFSFREFLEFKGTEFNSDNLTSSKISLILKNFNEYVEGGGFPEYVKTQKKDYLMNLYENILYRDIIVNNDLPNEKPIKEVLLYSVSNIGKEISFNKLRKTVGLTSATTVKEYFEYMENSYLCFLIQRYDPSLKKQIYYNKKTYFIDTGMSKILGFRTSRDFGRMVENIVFIQLKRKNKEIFFHKSKNECDFIVKSSIKIIDAIQVTEKMDQNKDREMKGLLEALKRYRLKSGLILTRDTEDEIMVDNKKIIVKPVWKWLLET
ncbi:AAA family ATPase [Candidatus Woesearchaeota archaeon]|nr:AAA family ATPase [Candidatus Woesearchaeota archaeon]